MKHVMMRLGEFGFGIDTAAYDELTLSHSWRWASLERFGRTPALQPIGPGSTNIRLTGVVYPQWRGGAEQFKRLKAMADKMEPLQLVDGLGFIWGWFVVERLTETQTHHTGQGAPRKQRFSLELKEYGLDAGDQRALP